VSKADKKQRQKKKREAKKREQRRRDSVSPFKRLADAPGDAEFWTTGDYSNEGQCEILVFKEAAGLSGVVAFLIDRGVVGLKEAWVRMGLSIGQFRETLDASRDRGLPMARTTAVDAAAVIAGALRWTRQNGMRLPKDWEKTIRILGPMPDIATADVSKFEMEFQGHPEDLRQRLIGEPFEAFIQRKDVSILFSDEAPFKGSALHKLDVPEEFYDQGDADEDDPAEIGAKELEETLRLITPPARMITEATTAWLLSKGETASPQLFEAWRSLLVAVSLAELSMPDSPVNEVSKLSIKMLEGLSDRIDDEILEVYEKAVVQARDHLAIDPELMIRHFDLFKLTKK
jgi:hypothetical protein